MGYVLFGFLRISTRYKPMFILFGNMLILLIFCGLLLLDSRLAVMSLIVLGISFLFILTRRIRTLVFVGLILTAENIFYIFDRSSLVFIYDLKQLVGVLLFVLFLVYLPKIIQSRFLLFRSVMVYMVYQIVAVFIAYFSIGQPLIKGVYTLMLPSLILGYFFFCFLIEDNRRYERFKTLLIYTSIAAGIIYILQALLYPRYIFLFSDFRFRYANIRFTEFSVFMLFTAFITLNELLVRPGREMGIRRLSYSIALLLQLGTFVFISQSRFLTITTLLLIVIALTALQKRFRRRLIIALMVWSTLGLGSLLILLNILGNTPRLDFLFETIEEIIKVSGNLNIRFNAAQYFVENLSGRWMIGWGALNIDFPKALIVSGRSFWHYFVDVGIVGYIYQYGIIGTLVTFLLLGHSLAISWKIYRKNQDIFFPLLCNGAVLINSFMVFFFQEVMALFYVGLIYAFMEFEYRKAFESERRVLTNEDPHDFTLSHASSQSGKQSPN